MDGKIQPDFKEKIDLDLIPVGIIITDKAGIICRLNCHAENLAYGRWFKGSLISDCLDIHGGRAMIGGTVYHVAVSPFESVDFHGTIYVLHSLEAVLQEESQHRIRETSEMVAEIAHEIRNPLGSIELLASLLRKTASGEKDLKRINQIILSVKTINERIMELLRLSKKRALRKQAFSLNRLILDIFRMPGQAESFLTFRAVGKEMFVEGDDKMIRQMFLNILIQILQVMPEESKLTVEIKRLCHGSKPYADVTFICDTQSSIFENVDLGMGVNLAIIHNIVHIHNGIVNIGINTVSILLPEIEG